MNFMKYKNFKIEELEPKLYKITSSITDHTYKYSSITNELWWLNPFLSVWELNTGTLPDRAGVIRYILFKEQLAEVLK